MKVFTRILGVAALACAGAFPAMAAVDVPTMTCASFSAMDTTGKMAAAGDLMAWIDDSANSETVGAELIGKYSESNNDTPWTAEKMQAEIEGHCKDAPADMTVVQRLKEHS